MPNVKTYFVTFGAIVISLILGKFAPLSWQLPLAIALFFLTVILHFYVKNSYVTAFLLMLNTYLLINYFFGVVV